MLVRHTLLYLPAQVISPVVQLASILIWAHILPPDALGVVTLVIAMQELAFCAFFMWWSHYALRYIARFKAADERLTFIRTELFAVVVSMLVQSVVLGPLLIWYFPDHMTIANAAVASGFLVTRSLAQYFGERARADTRIAVYTIVQTVGPVFGLGAGLLLMARFGPAPEWVFLGFIIAQVASLIAASAITDFGRSIGRPDKGILSESLRFGMPLMGAQMLAVVAINAPRFIVNHALGLAATGIFSVGYGLGIRASSFAVMLVTAGAYPLVVRKMETEGLAAAYEQLRKNITLVALAVMPMAFGLLAVNRSAVDVLIAEPLREVTYAVLPLTILGGLFRYLRAHTTDQVFLVRSKPNYAIVIAVTDLVLAVSSSYIGLYFLGLAGAAAGPMTSGIVTLAVSFGFAAVRFGFSPPIKAILGIFAAAMTMVAVLAALPHTTSIVTLGAYVALGGVVYVSALLAFVPMVRRLALSLISKFRARPA